MKLRTDIQYVTPDGRLTQAGVQAIQGQIDGISVSGLTVADFDAAAIVTAAETIAANDVDTAVPTAAAVIDYAERLWTYGTPVATTSGTTIVISTAIPSGVQDLEVMFNDVSLSSTDAVMVQIGAGGAFVTSGYIGSGIGISGAVNSTAGFPLRSNVAARAITGVMQLRLFDPSANTWIAAHSARSTTDNGSFGGGVVTLGGALDRIQLVVLGAGGSSYDAGSVNIRYR